MKKKIDVYIISARYTPGDGRVLLVQAYHRRGPIWTDIQLYDRKRLVELLQAGERVATGRPTQTPGEFLFLAQVRLTSGRLVVDGRLDMGEALSVPLF